MYGMPPAAAAQVSPTAAIDSSPGTSSSNELDEQILSQQLSSMSTPSQEGRGRDHRNQPSPTVIASQDSHHSSSHSHKTVSDSQVASQSPGHTGTGSLTASQSTGHSSFITVSSDTREAESQHVDQQPRTQDSSQGSSAHESTPRFEFDLSTHHLEEVHESRSATRPASRSSNRSSTGSKRGRDIDAGVRAWGNTGAP